MKIKNNHGFTGIDISISLIVMVLFVSLIASLLYNFHMSSQGINRKTDATYLAIQVLENLKQMNYDDIIEDSNGGMTVENLEKAVDIPSGYKVQLNIQNYREIANDSSLKDLIKVAKVTIQYTLGNIHEEVSMSTVITREVET